MTSFHVPPPINSPSAGSPVQLVALDNYDKGEFVGVGRHGVHDRLIYTTTEVGVSSVRIKPACQGETLEAWIEAKSLRTVEALMGPPKTTSKKTGQVPSPSKWAPPD